jgi:hypothetical protein
MKLKNQRSGPKGVVEPVKKICSLKHSRWTCSIKTLKMKYENAYCEIYVEIMHNNFRRHQGRRDSTGESSVCLRRHESLYFLCFVKWKLIYAHLLIKSWPSVCSILNIVCSSANKTVLSITTQSTGFAPVPVNFVPLGQQMIWESLYICN